MNDHSVYSQGRETEVSLSALFWTVLSKWRILLVWTLLFALLLGGVRVWKSGYLQSRQSVGAAPSEADSLKLLELEGEAELLQRELEIQELFVTRSLTMNVDPNALYTITNTYYVDAGYQILPENTYQSPDPTSALLEGYSAGLQAMNLASLAGDEKLPEEIGVFDWDKDLLVISTCKAKSGILVVSISGGTKEQAETLAVAVEEALAGATPTLEKAVCPHTLTLLGSVRSISRDETIEEFQTDQRKRIDDLRAELEAAVSRRDAFKSLLGQSGLGLKAVLKSAIKYALIGAFAGFLLCAGCYALKFLLGDRLLDGESLVIRYGARFLGVHGTGKKQTRLDAAIAKRRGIAPLREEEKSLRRMGASLQCAAKGMDRILLIGSVDQAQLERLAAQLAATGELGAAVTACGDVEADAGAIHAIAGAETVFCVEELGECSHRRIRGELATLAAQGKRCGGFLLLAKAGR